MNNFKMKNKLLTMFMVTGVIPILLLSGFFYYEIEGHLTKEIYAKNNIFLELTKEELNRYFSERKGDGRTLAKNQSIEELLNIYYEEGSYSESFLTQKVRTAEFLKTVVKEYNYTDIFITNEKGVGIFSVNNKNLKGAQLYRRNYIKKCLGGKQIWSDLFFSDVTAENIMTLSTPIYYENTADLIGTVNIIINQDRLNEIVHGGIEKIGKSGDSYLVNEEGLLFSETKQNKYKENAALKESINTRAIQLLSKEIKANNKEYTHMDRYNDYLNKPVFGSLGVITLGDKPMGLVIEVGEEEAFAQLKNIKKLIGIVNPILLAVGVILALFMANLIQKPIVEIAKKAKTVADLDLRENIDKKLIKRKDEVGIIGESVQSIIINLRSFLNQVGETSNQVAESSQELSATARQVNLVSEEVARTIEEIALSANNQAKDTQIGTENALDLGTIIEKNQEYLEQLNKSSNIIDRNVKEGLDVVYELVQKTNTTKKATEEIYSTSLEADNSSAAIGSASALIAQIAEKTNLLALNAAIEAARAGEHGRGFSVVAEEIRKLAEQSTKSTKEIDNIVTELINNSKKTVKSVETVKEIIGSQEESVKNIESKYGEISASVEVSLGVIGRLNESGETLEKGKNNILNIMENLSALAEENAASTEETSASTEEQRASVEGMASSSEALSDLAQELQKVISKFKI
ncbi:MAG: methyl-accepting chemotaxis protein [Anaeromicrobium sp.]|uniref:methyl-accepting chemotaxis protein n=1 Tax=Anaeromicrobium sp. TaxID=1929132 RepID=UPI0025EA0E68|nr:methyl-accepting chemotaxis protein [Anaeromicrobium sp.]MCT4594142.1 methyl-accepting chemotaxis protein [Anaeromicrobium sp.]